MLLGPEIRTLLGAALLGSRLLEAHMASAQVWGFDLSKPEDVVSQLRSLAAAATHSHAQIKFLAAASVANLRQTIDAPYIKAKRGISTDVIGALLGQYRDKSTQLLHVLQVQSCSLLLAPLTFLLITST